MYDPIETDGAGGLATPRVDGLERPDLLRDRGFVGGAWRDAGDGRRLAVADPADGALVGTVPDTPIGAMRFSRRRLAFSVGDSDTPPSPASGMMFTTAPPGPSGADSKYLRMPIDITLTASPRAASD